MKVDQLRVTNCNPFCPLVVFHYLTLGPKPPNAAAFVGTCFHTSMARNFHQKALTGKDEKLDDLKDVFVETFQNPEKEVVWDETPKSKRKENGLALVESYHEHFCPKLMPFSEEGVEVPLEIDMGDFKLTGHPDLVVKERKVVDHKSVTRKGNIKSKWRPEDAAGKPQSYGYALAGKSGLFGKKELFEVEYNIVAPCGTTGHVSTLKDEDQIKSWLMNVRYLHYMLEAEKPIANTQGWWCSQKWCGYWFDCEFGHKRMSYII